MSMKKIIFTSFLFFTAFGFNVKAQSEAITEKEEFAVAEKQAVSAEFQEQEELQEQRELQYLTNIQPQGWFDEYFDGLTKQISYDRMIPPYALEVTFDKTVHLIFPSAVSYVDLGSINYV